MGIVAASPLSTEALRSKRKDWLAWNQVYLAFQYFGFERRLMKVILSVPDEGYSERT
jgi:hypothetical protein